MLVFIDESGDSGLKFNKGSSKFFVISLVVFEENEEAFACDKRIETLKNEIGQNFKQEFHFKRNSHQTRKRFLKAVSPYQFFYYAIVMNKQKLYREGFEDKKSFYKYACNLVFENAKEKLDQANVIMDDGRDPDFQRQLEKYLKSKMNGRIKRIRKVKMQRSTSNNLLQLADYIAGIVNRSVSANKKSAKEYRQMIAHREISVQIWPKKENS